MGHVGLSAEQVAEWVIASCAAQGVAAKVTDPTVIGQVRTLLNGAAPDGLTRSGKRPALHRSKPPGRPHSAGIEPVADGRTDDRMIEHRSDDGALTVEVQLGPLSA